MQKIFRVIHLLVLVLIAAPAQAQILNKIFKKPVLTGMYLQWGYNRDVYSKSTIHFTNGDKYDFKVHDAVAHDQPNFEAFTKTPLDITIPQNSFRIGFYLNKKHTHAIEINFDHAKYVVDAKQTLRVSGTFQGREIDKDTLIHPYFMSFEHTNGANFYHVNYVGQHELWRNKKRMHASVIWKAGMGIVVPRSDVILFEKQTDNQFHVAGYVMGAESGFRFYPLKNLFLEATVKGGYANYLDVLTVQGGKASHAFRYGEVIGLIGYDINFKKKQKPENDK
ncbi:MAG: hypothetical protein EOP51_07655 [Sphingobacteriales bacterium]|nr:MAG: hypothetical protein EOP51_07655 [Sphingobacteriales bacterium]